MLAAGPVTGDQVDAIQKALVGAAAAPTDPPAPPSPWSMADGPAQPLPAATLLPVPGDGAEVGPPILIEALLTGTSTASLPIPGDSDTSGIGGITVPDSLTADPVHAGIRPAEIQSTLQDLDRLSGLG